MGRGCFHRSGRDQKKRRKKKKNMQRFMRFRGAATLGPVICQTRPHTHNATAKDGPPLTLTWVSKKAPWGPEKTVTAFEGQTLLEVSRDHEIGLEAACEGSLACSTCHCILTPEVFEGLAIPVEAEEDLLDLAYDLRPTSRLGCQVRVTKSMEGTRVELPVATRNFAVDGYKAPAH